MFRKMRRENKALTSEDGIRLLKSCRRAALAVNGEMGYPYSVPVNFYYEPDNNCIYFHSSRAGHKLDSIKNCSKVCFTTWDEGYLEEGDWAYYVSSCVVFGRAVLVDDESEALQMIKRFAMKYYPTEQEADDEIAADFHRVQLVRIEIEHMTAKKIQEK